VLVLPLVECAPPCGCCRDSFELINKKTDIQMLLVRFLVCRWPALAAPPFREPLGGRGGGGWVGGDLPSAVPASCPLLVAPS
jgi:hypothetical protein